MKNKGLKKYSVKFERAKIQVGQLHIVSDGTPEGTIIMLDGKPRTDIGRIDVSIDARFPLATVNAFFVPPTPKEAA
jgi:hypothetical protein